MTPPADNAAPPSRRHLFGPVPSRRLGLSLGLDLVPSKTCTYNCVFCQLGRTPRATLERREYVAVADVAAEFAGWLASGGTADAVTLSGSGEPTLHVRFGDVLREVRARCAIPAVLLTNGSLLHLPDVRRDACEAHIVKVSLGAWDQASFEALNRPAAGLAFETVLEGLRRFREEYAGTLWLEVFAVRGINASAAAMRRIADLAADLRPGRVHLNTAVRPPAEASVQSVSEEELQNLAALFRPTAEVIAEFPGGAGGHAAVPVGDDAIAALAARHPCTAADVAAVFGGDAAQAARRLEALVGAGRLTRARRRGRTYYGPTADAAS